VETTQYILEREHAQNNTEIIGYNGLMPSNKKQTNKQKKKLSNISFLL